MFNFYCFGQIQGGSGLLIQLKPWLFFSLTIIFLIVFIYTYSSNIQSKSGGKTSEKLITWKIWTVCQVKAQFSFYLKWPRGLACHDGIVGACWACYPEVSGLKLTGRKNYVVLSGQKFMHAHKNQLLSLPELVASKWPV